MCSCCVLLFLLLAIVLVCAYCVVLHVIYNVYVRCSCLSFYCVHLVLRVVSFPFSVCSLCLYVASVVVCVCMLLCVMFDCRVIIVVYGCFVLFRFHLSYFCACCVSVLLSCLLAL